MIFSLSQSILPWIISDAIGQGEILTTPIQLANLAAVIANKGYYYTPHLIKSIAGATIDTAFTNKHVSTINPKHFGPVIDGMEQVVQHGTAYWIRNDELGMCGKTGTALKCRRTETGAAEGRLPGRSGFGEYRWRKKGIGKKARPG